MRRLWTKIWNLYDVISGRRGTEADESHPVVEVYVAGAARRGAAPTHVIGPPSAPAARFGLCACSLGRGSKSGSVPAKKADLHPPESNPSIEKEGVTAATRSSSEHQPRTFIIQQHEAHHGNHLQGGGGDAGRRRRAVAVVVVDGDDEEEPRTSIRPSSICLSLSPSFFALSFVAPFVPKRAKPLLVVSSRVDRG
jgi:hypothetical protein